MNKFDSIRPYKDEEVNKVILELCNNKNVIKAAIASSKYSFIKKIPFSKLLMSIFLKNRFKNIQSIVEYQNIFKNLVKKIIKSSIKNFKVTGIDNLDKSNAYLFISNHRDITLDSALLNFQLHKSNLKTTNNAVGNNLLTEKWASDLMRLNKSFIIDRSDKFKKDIYKSLKLASEFIYDCITSKNESIWIAQKQGRSKDGVDYTDPSVLKMIHLNSRKKTEVSEYFNNLKLVPVSVSYEKDPNDILKAKELYLRSVNTDYVKEKNEDLKSIFVGISGHKGNVHIEVGEPMLFSNKEDYDEIAKITTKKIRSMYKIHATNIAACILQGIKIPIQHGFTNDEIDESMQWLKERLHDIPEDMQPFLLNQYSNPVL